MDKIFKIEIITHSEKISQLRKALKEKGIKGMTLTHVRGSGNQKGKVEVYRGVETEVALTDRVKVEILAIEAIMNTILEATKKALHTGNSGDGKIIITEVVNVIRISTNEEGVKAL